jgi:sulfide:quinone oxidoreductase
MPNMTPQKITETFTVSPQILAADIAGIAASGFKSVICNRPDGESPDQTPYAVIEAAVRKAGLDWRYIPVVSGAMTRGDVDAMAEALKELPAPVFAYCRSGARCGVLFRAVQAL